MFIEIEATEIDIKDFGSSLFGPLIKNNKYQTYIYNTKTGNLFDIKWNNMGKYNCDGSSWSKCYIYVDIINKSNLNSYMRLHPNYDKIVKNSTYVQNCRKHALKLENEDV